jgi:hypothetical protein
MLLSLLAPLLLLLLLLLPCKEHFPEGGEFGLLLTIAGLTHPSSLHRGSPLPPRLLLLLPLPPCVAQ